MTATDAALHELPFYNLNDKEFNFVNGLCSYQIDQYMDIDLYDMIPNPDKSDETDPDLMLTFPQSDYFSISKMNNVLNNAGPKALSMLHCNIRSLPKNMTLLDDMLCSIDKRQDILSLTETKLNANTITNVDLPNYNFYHTDSPTPAGGTAIYI